MDVLHVRAVQVTAGRVARLRQSPTVKQIHNAGSSGMLSVGS